MSSRMKPFNLIYEAEWNDIPCSDYPLTPERWVRESLEPLRDTQVDTLLYNLCSSDGFCCQLDHGELLMEGFEKLDSAWLWRYRENAKELIRRDANPPKLAVEHGRRVGLKMLPVVRMNDAHDQYFKYEVSRFKLANPQLLIGHKTGYIDWEKGWSGHPDRTSIECFTWGLFDYAHAEVRDHKFAIIEEFATRWDNDGISLDFDRDPCLFAEEGNPENARLMTDLIRRIRALLDETEKKRGRDLFLHVRVIPDIAVCSERGMDVKTWVEEGLVDAITPGCGYMTFSLDLAPWLELVAGKPCWIYAGSNHWKPPEEARAWAKLMYQRGAHGLHLFNWGHLLHGFDRDTPPAARGKGSVYLDELHPCYYEALGQIGRLDTMACKDATYVLESIPHKLLPGPNGANSRRHRAIDAIELPVELSVGKHAIKLPFAEDAEDARRRGFSTVVTLRLKIENYTYPDQFDVFVNDEKLDAKTRSTRAVHIMDNDTWVTYPVGIDLLRPGNNTLAIEVHQLNPQMSVAPVLKNVELAARWNRSA